MMNLNKVELPALIVLALVSTGNTRSIVGPGSREDSARNLITAAAVQAPAGCNGNIALTSQAQVDAFPATYGCSVITGTLSISGSDITNLDSLYSITRIDGNPGNLSVTGNPMLKNINGLSSLSYVGYGWVYISDNPSLTNLKGLSSLTQISRGGISAGLQINNNALLADVDGLSALIDIEGAKRYLTVTDNPQLARCCGLYNVVKSPSLNCSYGCSFVTFSGNGAGCTREDILAGGPCPVVCSGNVTLGSQAEVDAFPATHGCSEITGKLTISGTGITNLDSLHSLTQVGELLITGNDSLTNLNGLSNLHLLTTTCSGLNCAVPNIGFTITNNALLSDISGLASLTKIGSSLVISSNPKLANLDGLNHVASIGGRLLIENDATLSNLNGLSSLATVGYSLGINNNPSLTSLEGLRLITSIPGVLYIINNASLPNLNGLQSVTQLIGTTDAYLTISGNASLTNIDALSALTIIKGNPTGGLRISNNAALANLNGLHSLTEIRGGLGSGTLEITNNPLLHEVDGLSSVVTLAGFNLSLTIQDNASLTNVNGLSSINLSSPRPSIRVNNNSALGQCCGLYQLISYAGRTPDGYVDISGNGAGCTKADILAGGPCTPGPTQPTNMVFSAVTDTTMTVSFTAAAPSPTGYITLMRPSSSPYPADVPVDGTVYQVGDHIGNSTVAGIGSGTSVSVTNLTFSTVYYFDVFSHNNYNYLTTNPLAGSQRTNDAPEPTAQPTNLSFSAVTGTGMNVLFTAASPSAAGYIALMRPASSPYPNDVPVDGTVYQVGESIGNSTVAGFGSGTNFSVTNLSAGTVYYFDVFSHNNYNYLTTNPLAGSQSTTNSSSGGRVQPTNIIFSAVTDTTMTVSFTPAAGASGYITLMQAFGSPYPDDSPVNGTTYHVGDVIGSSTIVVGAGSETSLDIVYLWPGINYYFDVFSYNNPNGVYDYLTADPLAGSQRTTSSGSASARTADPKLSGRYSGDVTGNDHISPYPNPFSEDITIPFTTKGQNTFVQIAIYDALGKRIADVVNQNFAAGYHEAKWTRTDSSGNKVSQGMYLFSIRTSEAKGILRGTLVAK